MGYKIMVCEQVVAMVHSLNRDLVSPVLCLIDPRIASYCLVVYLRKGNTSHHTVSKNTQNQFYSMLINKHSSCQWPSTGLTLPSNLGVVARPGGPLGCLSITCHCKPGCQILKSKNHSWQHFQVKS